VGIGCNMLISIFLLPRWRRVLSVECRGERIAGPPSTLDTRHSTLGPSSLYRAQFWQLGLCLVRFFPTGFCLWLSRCLAGLYWSSARHRRRIVIENLAPVIDGQAEMARQKARKLFDNFAFKLVDLWRYEAGLPIDSLLGQNSGW